MDKKDYDGFSNLLEDMLNAYDDLEDKTKLNDFLEKEIKSSGINRDNNEAKDIVDEISSTVDMIATKFNDLQEFKKQGKSREEWLEKELNVALSKFDDNQKSIIIKQVDDALKKNKAELSDILNKLKEIKVYE
ncbi:MAG TPA: hypothetical protein PK385_01530 [Spirochaetota bacterium]|nr:hypothetical protein [Spirochaetota bacterium]HOS32656.1 hypothetical protein [Spirochaetota bacterium]HOS54717.1 hypothetical protein [Spirochaetota bacterium]HQF76605.1 hypothetical protein [Spirochaetota bacterium]HQH30083.1 hypothetical protein [Spirochaetota bacterium]